MSIQQDVIDAIGDGIPVADLRDRLQGRTVNEIRCAVDALMRAMRLRIEAGIYRVVPASRALGTLPKPLSAEPVRVTKSCITCGTPQPLIQFRIVGPGKGRADECDTCVENKKRAWQAIQNGSNGAAATGPTVVFHSAQRQTPIHDSSGVDNDTRHVGLTAPRQNGACVGEASEGELPLAGCNSPPAVASLDSSASPHPKPAVIGTAAPGSQADPAITRARAQRHVAINHITMLEVDIANQRARLARLENFLEFYDELVKS